MTTQPATCLRCLQKVVDPARQDLLKLQHGGVDAPVVSSAFSLPFLTTVKLATTAAMARIVGVYAGGFSLWNTNVGETVRHKVRRVPI